MSLAELMGISQKDAYEIAELGYQLMIHGKNTEAIKIFEGLLVLNPEDSYLKTLLDKARHHDQQLAGTNSKQPLFSRGS